jgi:hypothetical protein
MKGGVHSIPVDLECLQERAGARKRVARLESTALDLGYNSSSQIQKTGRFAFVAISSKSFLTFAIGAVQRRPSRLRKSGT